MICDRYDVAVIPFPFADIPVIKRRPAVVLSGRPFNETNGSTLVAMITSSTLDTWPSDVAISDLESTGLKVKCKVRWRLTTIPNDLIVRSIGKLQGADRLGCERELAKMLT
ncbi:MAG: type II toxin-antitoxin system PemK/MazF family toxin [Rhizobiaceae bacterium]